MAGTARAVRRHGMPRIGSRRYFGGSRVEQQEHALPAAEEDVAPFHLADLGEAETVAVECLGRGEIGHVERGFEHRGGSHAAPSLLLAASIGPVRTPPSS